MEVDVEGAIEGSHYEQTIDHRGFDELVGDNRSFGIKLDPNDGCSIDVIGEDLWRGGGWRPFGSPESD